MTVVASGGAAFESTGWRAGSVATVEAGAACRAGPCESAVKAQAAANAATTRASDAMGDDCMATFDPFANRSLDRWALRRLPGRMAPNQHWRARCLGDVAQATSIGAIRPNPDSSDGGTPVTLQWLREYLASSGAPAACAARRVLTQQSKCRSGNIGAIKTCARSRHGLRGRVNGQYRGAVNDQALIPARVWPRRCPSGCHFLAATT